MTGTSSSLRFDILEHVDGAEWNERLARFGGESVFQTAEWAAYVRSYLRAIPHFVVGYHGNEPVAQLLVVESLRGRESLGHWMNDALAAVAAPVLRVLGWREGPVIHPRIANEEAFGACLSAVERLAAARGATAIEDAYGPIVSGDTPLDCWHWTRRGYETEMRGTVVVPLDRPLAEIWNGLKEGVTRTPVRKGEQQGLDLQEVDTPSDLAEFIGLVHAWRSAQGLVPYTAAKYELMFTEMRRCSSIFLARQHGISVGGIGVWHFGRKAHLFTPVQSAIAREGRIYAGDFLFWRLIEWCHARGIQTLDLSGIALSPRSDKEKGIRRFKEKWGYVVEYTAAHRVCRPTTWRLVNAVQAAKRAVRTAMKAEPSQ